MYEVIKAVDDLDASYLEDALSDFLRERGLVDEFLVWIEKWKSIHLPRSRG